jgi:hypothetical protein
MIGSEYLDRELDLFIADKIMQEKAVLPYTSSIADAWRVVEKMMRKFHCELKLDVFLGITGEHWVASFYSPTLLRRFEAKGKNAPLAICRAARETFTNLFMAV